LRRLRAAAPQRQSGFLLNRSNDRRVIDGVSTRSKHFERTPQDTRSRPACNLFSDLPEPQPGISTESNRSELLSCLADSVQSTRLALELDGCAALTIHNFKRTFGAKDRHTPRIGANHANDPNTPANEPGISQPLFQET
jgi:hypothetical protein